MSPKQIVEVWVQRFNKSDIDGLMELYEDNAVNHQVVTEPLYGRQAIRAFFETEFCRAKMNCRTENLIESGDWAVLEWSDPLGLRGCGIFQIQNEKIVSQRGYFDQLTFFRLHDLPVPESYLNSK